MRRPLLRGLAAIVVATGGMSGALLTGQAPAMAAATVLGTVATGSGNLIVRAEPAVTAARVGHLAKGARVEIDCQKVGSFVDGRVRDTDRWDRLAGGGYISDAYVTRPDQVTPALCDDEAPE